MTLAIGDPDRTLAVKTRSICVGVDPVQQVDRVVFSEGQAIAASPIVAERHVDLATSHHGSWLDRRYYYA